MLSTGPAWPLDTPETVSLAVLTVQHSEDVPSGSLPSPVLLNILINESAFKVTLVN